MVFVKDFKRDFYEKILHQRVLVLVSFDVDALAACKILQYLFQCDHILYTIVPVKSKTDLEVAFAENAEGFQNVIMINCGGTQDVIEDLQPEENVVFYICDSHRPIDVHNIYNQIQVQLLMKPEEFTDVPEYEQVFRDDDSDSDSGDESDENSDPMTKRKRFDPERLEKRRERRLWEERRQKLIFEYLEFSGYGSSVSYLLFELAWKMSKDTNDLLWLSIVGVTAQFLHNQIDRDKYIEIIGQVQSHVSRHNHRLDGEDNAKSVDCLKIAFDQELKLRMYRHWSLFESMCHTQEVACKFKIWTAKGKKRLHEFLADMGLPLVQCKQKYSSMDVHLKENIKESISQQQEKYNFTEQELFLPSFNAQYGYKHKLCAADVVNSCEAVLESVEKDQSSSTFFLKALDTLTRKNTDSLDKGIEKAKLQLSAIVNQVQSFLDMSQVISAGPFLYAFVQEGTPDISFFSKPICFQKLAMFTLEAYCSMSKSRKAGLLPLVLGTPTSSEEGTMLIIGIPPASESTCKNFFGKAFEQAAASTSARTMQDNFDTHIIELKTEDKSKFFDSLISLLQ